MAAKHLEFVFVPQAQPKTFCIPNAPQENINQRLFDYFQSDFQLTAWQQNAFPEDKPLPNSRTQAGYLRDGDPIFFLVEGNDPNKLLFFGRAQMFRLPYHNSPKALIQKRQPALLDRDVIDFADAIFGFVPPDKSTTYRQGDKRSAYAGRVSFTDAILADAPDGIYDTDEPITPPILSTPKPTTFQHYLEQTTKDRRQLLHYDSDHARVRGRKMYWRARLDTTETIHQAHVDVDSSTQHTRLRAVKTGVTFSFCVHFENLTSVELGALAWALMLPGVRDGRHMLGMGKPFGMGVVKLDAKLRLNNRQTRYKALFSGDAWATGDDQDDSDVRGDITEFTTFVERKTGQSFTSIESIETLHAMLKLRERSPKQVEGRLIDSLFDYQIIDPDHDINDYYSRPILPDAVAVGQQDDQRAQAVIAVQREAERKQRQAEKAASGIKVGDIVGGEIQYETDDQEIVFVLKRPFEDARYIGYITPESRRGIPAIKGQGIEGTVLDITESEGRIQLWCDRQKRAKRK